jgi:terminase small subunit / prophage DNA-packing protein
MKFDSDTTVSARELGELLGVTARAVRGLAERRVIARANRGRYPLVASIRACLAHYREVAAGRGTEQGMLDLSQERARLAKLQADGQELKNASVRREVIEVSEAQELWFGFAHDVRSGGLSLPGRIAFEVPTLSPTDRSTIERIVVDWLQDLALHRGEISSDLSAPVDKTGNGGSHDPSRG